MSHLPQVCDHVLSAWTPTERVNEAGDRTFVFQRCCYQCPFVEEESGAIIEPSPMRYARIQGVSGEPDD